VQAKGVLMVRVLVFGTSAHGSTPWLGDNAVLKAIDVFRRIESMPFTLESSELFDRPSVNLGRIVGGDAPNKVPEECAMDVDIRYLPEQDRACCSPRSGRSPDVHVARAFIWPPARVSPRNEYVVALCRPRRG
jgi:succinyl-diaminopimelate desuccinylase